MFLTDDSILCCYFQPFFFPSAFQPRKQTCSIMAQLFIVVIGPLGACHSSLDKTLITKIFNDNFQVKLIFSCGGGVTSTHGFDATCAIHTQTRRTAIAHKYSCASSCGFYCRLQIAPLRICRLCVSSSAHFKKKKGEKKEPGDNGETNTSILKVDGLSIETSGEGTRGGDGG